MSQSNSTNGAGGSTERRATTKGQRCSELELEIQRLVELEAKEREALEKKYTMDDLTFAWQFGYDSRVA